MTSIELGIRALIEKHPVLKSEIVYYFSPKDNDLSHLLRASLNGLFHKFAQTSVKRLAKTAATGFAQDAWTTASEDVEDVEEGDQDNEQEEGEEDEDSYEFKATIWTARTAAGLVLQRLVPYHLSKQPLNLHYLTVSFVLSLHQF